MSKNREKILVIGHVWPQPNATAAGVHLLHILACFHEMNYAIYFTSAAVKPDHFSFPENLAIQSFTTAINDDAFDVILKDLQPSIVLFDRFMVEEQFSWRVKKHCPKAIRVLDTEDLHFLRKEREVRYKAHSNDIIESPISDTAKREVASIYRSDISLIISSVEIKILVERYKVPKSILFYFPLVSDGIKLETKTFEERKDIFFVGNFLHEPNWQTVLRLKKEIWPKLSKQLPEAALHIYGSHAQVKHLQLSKPSERFIVKGYVDDINAVFNSYKLLLAPIPFGAGQKGKLLKALENRLPFVTTSVGAEAMSLENLNTLLVGNTATDIINKTCNLYKKASLWENSIVEMPDILLKNFDKKVHFERLSTHVNATLNDLENHRNTNITGEILWHHSMRSTEFMSRWIIEKNKNS